MLCLLLYNIFLRCFCLFILLFIYLFIYLYFCGFSGMYGGYVILQTEQLYTYFVRRHLNRVAQKCQEEGRKMQVNTAELLGPLPDVNDINLIYRQLVISSLFFKFNIYILFLT